MKNIASALERGHSHPVSTINERRQVSWLLDLYSAPVWTVTDTYDPTIQERIDFRLRMPDGSCLTENARMYATVKEYAWWIRDSRFSSLDDAETHLSYVRKLMIIAHALHLRGISSFAHVGSYEIDQLVEECRYGRDAVLKASERVEAYLRELSEKNCLSALPDGGLPRYLGYNGKLTRIVAAAPIMEACNLPDGAASLPRVAWHIAMAAARQGLRTRTPPAEEIPPLTNLTASSLGCWLNPLEFLFTIRRYIEAETISFKPFAEGAGAVAIKKGMGTERTPIAPPRLALHLLEHSARWVTDYSDPIASSLLAADQPEAPYSARIQESERFIESLPGHGSLGSPWPLAAGDRRREGALSVGKAIRYLATACWIVVAAFSARRYEEIMDLETDCLRGNDEDGWFLHIYIEKTLQRKEWIPVPHLVARAIETLRRISERARLETQNPRLFQWINPFSTSGSGAHYAFNPRDLLDEFAGHVQVPLHKPNKKDPEQAWHWHPHQFRRFFAVLYFYRYEGGSLEALSHHLRHFDLNMTRRYVTLDPEVAAISNDVEWGYMGHVARTIVSGERSVSGGMGEKLKKRTELLIDIFRRRLRIASPARVGATLRLIMQRRGLVLTPKPWVICSCPRTRAAALKARCQSGREIPEDAVGPRFESAGPTVCPFCPFAITEQARQPFVDRQVEHLELVKVSAAREGTMFGELEQARLIDLSQIRDKRYEQASAIGGADLDEEDAA